MNLKEAIAQEQARRLAAFEAEQRRKEEAERERERVKRIVAAKFAEYIAQSEGISTTADDWEVNTYEPPNGNPSVHTLSLKYEGRGHVKLEVGFILDERGELTPDSAIEARPWRSSLGGTYVNCRTLVEACLAAGFIV